MNKNQLSRIGLTRRQVLEASLAAGVVAAVPPAVRAAGSSALDGAEVPLPRHRRG